MLLDEELDEDVLEDEELEGDELLVGPELLEMTFWSLSGS